MIPKGQGTGPPPPHQYFWDMQSWFQRFPDAGQQAWSWANLCWDTGPLAITWHGEKDTSFANNLPTLTGDRSGCIHLEDLRSNNHHTPQEGFSWPCVWLQCHWWFLSPQLWCCLARCTSSWRSSPWCWMMLNGLAMFSVSHVLLSLDWDILGPAGRHMKAKIFNGRRSLRCFTCCDCPISELQKSKGPRVHSYCYDLCGGSCRAEDLEVSIRGRLGDPDECLRRWRNSDAGYRSSTFRPIFAGSHCIVRCYHAEEWGMRMLKNT